MTIYCINRVQPAILTKKKKKKEEERASGTVPLGQTKST